MKEIPQTREIGLVGNYYGCLTVSQSESGQYLWSIENWDGHHWMEIPEYLYTALNRHQDELDKDD